MAWSIYSDCGGKYDVCEIKADDDIARAATDLARAYAGIGREWFLVGVPGADALAARIQQLYASVRDSAVRSTLAESGGVGVARRGKRYFIRADKVLHQLLHDKLSE